MKRHLDFSNSSPPPHALWRVLEPQKEGVRERLARQWGVDTEEIAITRNASESLQICQLGIRRQFAQVALCAARNGVAVRPSRQDQGLVAHAGRG
jgi:selenocysteine lyase/cysteine desulfurase